MNNENNNSKKIIKELSIDKLKEFENYPFKIYDDENLNKLAKNIIIKQQLRVPIIVRPIKNSNMYEVVSNYNIVEAAKKAELEKIEAEIRKINDKQAIGILIKSILERRPFSEWSECEKTNSIMQYCRIMKKQDSITNKFLQDTAKIYQVKNSAIEWRSINDRDYNESPHRNGSLALNRKKEDIIEYYILRGKLIEPLQKRLNNEINNHIAEYISFLTEEEQAVIETYLEDGKYKFTVSKAKKIYNLSKDKEFGIDRVEAILKKTNILIDYDILAKKIAYEKYPDEDDMNIADLREKAQSAISRELRNLCKIFRLKSNKNSYKILNKKTSKKSKKKIYVPRPIFEKFPISDFDESERSKLIEKIYETKYFNRQIIDNLTKNSDIKELRSLYNISGLMTTSAWNNTIVEKIKTAVCAREYITIDENGNKNKRKIRTNLSTPVGEDINELLRFEFRYDKNIAEILNYHEENKTIFTPLVFVQDRINLTEKYFFSIETLCKYYQDIYDLYEKYNISNYHTGEITDADYSDFIYGYFGFIIDSFVSFCNIHMVENGLLNKEKRLESLNKIYEKLKNSQELKYEASEIKNQATDIFKAFDIFIIYLYKKNDFKNTYEIYSFLLEDTETNKEFFEPIDNKYKIDFRDLKRTLNNLRKENLDVVAYLEDIFAEGETFSKTNGVKISNFKKKLEKTKDILKFCDDCLDVYDNDYYIFDLKSVFREMFIYNRDYEVLRKRLNKKSKDKSTKGRIKKPEKLMLDFIKELKENDAPLPFAQKIEYKLLKAVWDCSHYREYGLLDEYVISHKIYNYLTESLLNIFFSFERSAIMQKLCKTSQILKDILMEEFGSLILMKQDGSAWDEMQKMKRKSSTYTRDDFVAKNIKEIHYNVAKNLGIKIEDETDMNNLMQGLSDFIEAFDKN